MEIYKAISLLHWTSREQLTTTAEHMQPLRPTVLATNLGLICIMTKSRREAGASLPHFSTNTSTPKGANKAAFGHRLKLTVPTCTNHSAFWNLASFKYNF